MGRREPRRSVPARDRAEISHILDLFAADSRRNDGTVIALRRLGTGLVSCPRKTTGPGMIPGRARSLGDRGRNSR
jgi:hypothetical protein